MHPVHYYCHHIKSCHPHVKQYLMTHHKTEFIMYTCSLFFICNTNGSTCQTKNHLERQEHQNKTQNKINARPGHDNVPVCMWDLDTHCRTTEENPIARV